MFPSFGKFRLRDKPFFCLLKGHLFGLCRFMRLSGWFTDVFVLKRSCSKEDVRLGFGLHVEEFNIRKSHSPMP